MLVSSLTFHVSTIIKKIGQQKNIHLDFPVKLYHQFIKVVASISKLIKIQKLFNIQTTQPWNVLTNYAVDSLTHLQNLHVLNFYD